MGTTHLIVNADDFGESRAVNEAIVKAHVQGIVTSTSLMVTGRALKQAVDMARAHPDLRVGLHLVLLLGRPCLPPHEIPLLVNEQGVFPNDAVSAGIRWFFSRKAQEQIRREVQAQIECFLRTGLPMDHVNAHLHFHVHPVVFEVLLDEMEKIGVKRMRLPQEPWRISLPVDVRHPLRKIGYTLTFGMLARTYRKRLKQRGIFFPQAVFGILQTGEISEAYLLRLIPRLPSGSVEFYAHPRYDTLAGLRELHALVSPRVSISLRSQGIDLTTYTEAAAHLMEAGEPPSRR